MRRTCIGVLTAVLIGCGSAPRDALVPPDEVPAQVLAAAREKLPDVAFDQVLKRSDGRYEVRGKDSRGKVRSIDISESGEVLEIE
ncbi:MAG: PepSY domain-containing protein [Deltaproteobacteria bacterium]